MGISLNKFKISTGFQLIYAHINSVLHYSKQLWILKNIKWKSSGIPLNERKHDAG
jgi:hypothetical protein